MPAVKTGQLSRLASSRKNWPNGKDTNKVTKLDPTSGT